MLIQHTFGARAISVIATILVLVTTTTSTAFADHDSGESDPVTVAWIPYWDQPAALESYQLNREQISHVSFFWYYLDQQGEIQQYMYADTSADHILQVKSNGDKAYALIANLPDLQPDDPAGGWNRDIVRQVLEDSAARKQHINDLVSLAVDREFDGINIDYENLRRQDRELYTTFIKELGSALDQIDKELAIALHPKTEEFKPSEDNGSHAQDWVTLSNHADQLHIMGYGEHYPGSSPGPVASIQWLEKILLYLTSLDVDKDKFVMGIPLYAEVWNFDGPNGTEGIKRDFNYQKIESLKLKYNSFVEHLVDLSSNRLGYTDDNGNKHIAYFENANSTGSKITLSRKYGVENFAFWRIGGEDPRLWQLLASPR